MAFEINAEGVLVKYIPTPGVPETEVVIPEGVTKIGWKVFLGCTNLASVVIPEGVTEIGVWAFSDCTSLASVVIPESVTKIRWQAFGDCPALKHIYCSGEAEVTRIRGLLPSEFHDRVENKRWSEDREAFLTAAVVFSRDVAEGRRSHYYAERSEVLPD